MGGLPEFTHHHSHYRTDNYSARILFCGCDISPGLTVIMVLELTVAVIQFRKLSKPIFASAMKSTLEKKQMLQRAQVVLNTNSGISDIYFNVC